MITLTDPSIMCSVPLQLEKILDGEKEGGGLTHNPDGGGEDAQTVDGGIKKKNGCFQGRSILVGHEGEYLIAPKG